MECAVTSAGLLLYNCMFVAWRQKYVVAERGVKIELSCAWFINTVMNVY
jgi:hypothetical protein